MNASIRTSFFLAFVLSIGCLPLLSQEKLPVRPREQKVSAKDQSAASETGSQQPKERTRAEELKDKINGLAAKLDEFIKEKEQCESKAAKPARTEEGEKQKRSCSERLENQVRDEFSQDANPQLFIFSLLPSESEIHQQMNQRTDIAKQDYVRAAEDVRVDEQVGSEPANSGSTSLVSKGSVPSILGFAVDNGALTKTTSGTTITFRGNPVGIVQAFQKQGFIESYCKKQACPETSFLRKFSFAFSFDANRGTTQGTFTGDLQQLASYSVRYDILNRRDSRDVVYRDSWARLIQQKSQPLLNLEVRLAAYLSKDPLFQSWLKLAQDRVINAKSGDATKVIEEEVLKLQSLEQQAPLKRFLDQYSAGWSAYLNDRNALLEEVNKGMIFTFEYTGLRQVKAPNLSNFKLVAEGALYKGKVNLTSNVSLTILNSVGINSKSKKLNDIQFSGQIDVPLGQVQRISSFIFSMSGMYKRMMNNAMTSTGTEMMNTKGDIAVGQLKLTIPAKGTGVKIPISLTIANRTELIKEREVRGNIGVTFDMDSIFAKLKP